MAHAGIAQWMRQWVLIKHRERFDPRTPVHRLHFSFGGSATHAGAYFLDIETGREPGGTDHWSATVAEATQGDVGGARGRGPARARGTALQTPAEPVDQADMEEVIRLLQGEPDRKATARRLRDLTGWRKDKADRLMAALADEGLIQPAKVEVAMGASGRIQTFDGVQLSVRDGDGGQS
jgi:hypothetical protein